MEAISLSVSNHPQVSQLNNYQQLKLLGEGSIGKVYLVNEKTTGKEYAMKVINKADMLARNKLKRVYTEREILATTHHPFIVNLHCSFTDSENIYFVMHYCAGGQFFKMLQRQPEKHLCEESAKFYAAETFLALEYLHSNGFIYRDLKPENILLEDNGHIMLADFDLAKQSTSAYLEIIAECECMNDHKCHKCEHIIDSNSFVGTLEYLAPEVINGKGHCSSLDWWTFGILIYEMLFGHTPFEGRNRYGIEHHITHDNLKIPSEPHISSNCKSLLKGLICIDPDKRFRPLDIKCHKWFKSINLNLIRNLTPPLHTI